MSGSKIAPNAACFDKTASFDKRGIRTVRQVSTAEAMR